MTAVVEARPIPTLTAQEEWLGAIEAAFQVAVAALEKGESPSKIRPTSERLTHGEWQAVLEAARREVARR